MFSFACPTVISLISGKSFHFLFPYFVINCNLHTYNTKNSNDFHVHTVNTSLHKMGDTSLDKNMVFNALPQSIKLHWKRKKSVEIKGKGIIIETPLLFDK